MLNLETAIRQAKALGAAPIIAEIKRVIPKLGGVYRPDVREASLLARLYEEGGAVAISVVTESRHFGGKPAEDLPAVLEAVPLPVLIKDFIVDNSRIDYYAHLIRSVKEADLNRVTLLLISHLASEKTGELMKHIHHYGMTVLLETRKVKDLEYPGHNAGCLRLVGINNKVIDVMETDDNRVGLTPEMIRDYRRLVGEALIISESAHLRPLDVCKSLDAGADAVLAGTAFMQAECPRSAVSQFVNCREVV